MDISRKPLRSTREREASLIFWRNLQKKSGADERRYRPNIDATAEAE
jgi:hypothetical protein